MADPSPPYRKAPRGCNSNTLSSSSSCSSMFALFLHLAPSSSYCSFIFVLLNNLRLAPSSSSCSFIFVMLLHLAPSSSSFGAHSRDVQVAGLARFQYLQFYYHLHTNRNTLCEGHERRIFVLLLHLRLAPSSSSCSFIFVLLFHLRLANKSTSC